MSKIKKFCKKNTYYLYLLIALAIIFIAMLFINTSFFTLGNFISMLEQMTDYAMMALGIMICICAGGIDLSTVGVANMVAAITASLLLKFVPEGTSVGGVIVGSILLVILAIVVGFAAGAFNGTLITKLGIPPMLATMSTNYLYTGICMVITKGVSLSGINQNFVDMFTFKAFNIIPLGIIVFVIAAIYMWISLTKGTFGVKLCMVGTNPTATMFAGINNDWIKIRTHITSSVLSAITGVLMLARLSSSRSDYGKSYSTQAILIVILGGTAAVGGTFSIPGTIIGIFIIQAITTGVGMTPGANSYLKNLVYATLLLAVMIIDYFRTNRKVKVKK